jgi:sec-independent protein translocase protein TatA
MVGWFERHGRAKSLYLATGNAEAEMALETVPTFIGGLGAPEMVVVFLIAVLLFGANKIPKLARSTGEAMGEFQKGREEVEEELQDMREGNISGSSDGSGFDEDGSAFDETTSASETTTESTSAATDADAETESN